MIQINTDFANRNNQSHVANKLAGKIIKTYHLAEMHMKHVAIKRAVLCIIWQSRNRVVFEHYTPNVHQAHHMVRYHTREWTYAETSQDTEMNTTTKEGVSLCFGGLQIMVGTSYHWK